VNREIIRIGIVGCGRITGNMHLPAVLSSKYADLKILIDSDIKVAAGLSHKYGLKCEVSNDYRKAVGHVDAVIIATPNNTHYHIAEYFIENGVHVLIEKPLTVSDNDARELCALAEKHKCIISVGYVTRHFSSTKMMKEMLEKKYFGEIESFDYEFGSKGGWAPLSGYNLNKDSAGGGVLVISGSHFIDRMIYWFGKPEILKCSSDSHGGVEANFWAKFRFRHDDRDIIGNMTVSKTYKLRNSFKLYGSKWDAELPEGRADSIFLKAKEADLDYDYRIYRNRTDLKNPEYYYFYVQLEDFIESIKNGRTPLVDGYTGLKSVMLINEMYKKAESVAEPWLYTKNISDNTRDGLSKEKILVTGASGFVGGALCEYLYKQKICDFRAMIHSSGNAARIARLPIEIVMADLLNEAEVNRSVQGCSMIVNLVRGGIAVDTNGLHNLLNAALKFGVKKVVHLSSVAVYGDNPPAGSEDEAYPADPGNNKYGQLKLKQEKIIKKYVERGLPAIIFRPPNICGPFSMYTMSIIDRIRAGKILLLDEGRNPCNIVHVYNLVDAIMLGLDSTRSNGESYFITDDDPITWKDFVEAHVRMCNVEMDNRSMQSDNARNSVLRNQASFGKSVINALKFFISGEFRGLMSKNIPLFNNINSYIYREFEKSDPKFKEYVRMKLSKPERIEKMEQDIMIYDQFMSQQNRRIRHSNKRAKSELNFKPRLDFNEGTANTYEWLAAAKYLRNKES
jgi:predicted dehydrogenase/nucleoside-diphosphate-sugar epimerase